MKIITSRRRCPASGRGASAPSRWSWWWISWLLLCLFVCTVPAAALPTPAQVEEIQTALDKGKQAKELADRLDSRMNSETDEAKRKDLVPRWFQADTEWKYWRKRAIELADLYFEIPQPSKRKQEPQFDPDCVEEGHTNHKGRVFIGERAFRTPVVLATTKLHEFQHSYQIYDWERRPDDTPCRKARCMMEIEAYDTELANAEKLGLPKVEIEKVIRRRTEYFNELTPENKSRVKALNYQAESVLLKDALDYHWVKAEFKGQGVAAGKILEARFSPLVQFPVRLEIAAGTVLKPNQGDVQTMMVGDDVYVDVDKGVMTVMLPGYCLDPAKLPPPPPEEKPGLTFSVEEPRDADRYPAAASVIRAGNRLSGDSSFHNDLPPEKYRDTVIQRSLWFQADPTWDKARLRQDLTQQVEKSGGKQTPEQIETLTSHLWDDVDLTLKAAKNP